jgi:dCMP deaminase
MSPLRDKYLNLFMAQAYAAEAQTEAVRERVGCVIVSPSGAMVTGWNGQPAGHHTNCCENTEVLEADPITGILATRMKTDRSVLHAENNAMGWALRSGTSLQGAWMFTTVAPCDVCARTIIPSGISRVFFHRFHDDMTGIELLAEAGIDIRSMRYFKE